MSDEKRMADARERAIKKLIKPLEDRNMTEEEGFEMAKNLATTYEIIDESLQNGSITQEEYDVIAQRLEPLGAALMFYQIKLTMERNGEEFDISKL